MSFEAFLEGAGLAIVYLARAPAVLALDAYRGLPLLGERALVDVQSAVLAASKKLVELGARLPQRLSVAPRRNPDELLQRLVVGLRYGFGEALHVLAPGSSRQPTQIFLGLSGAIHSPGNEAGRVVLAQSH